MGNKKKHKSITRRGFMPLAGAGVFMPFLGHSKPTKMDPKEDDEFTTMLTPDGEVVKVKRSALKNVKVLEKNMSNISLLNWLKPKKSDNR